MVQGGFMVVPVWEGAVQIGSVVWEDPFLGFGSPPARSPPPPNSGKPGPAAAPNSTLFTSPTVYGLLLPSPLLRPYHLAPFQCRGCCVCGC